MAENRLHLIHIHSAVAKVPDSNADLRYGEIAVQYATSDPALYIKKADNTYAKFVPNIDISGTTTGSGNVVTGVSVSNNMVTAALGNVVDSATGDSLISATVSGGTQVVVSATTGLTDAVNKAHKHSNKALLDTYTQTETDLADAVAKKHEHDNKTVLDGITSGKVESWDEAAESAHTHANKALLDTYTQTEADLADAVAKKHEHANKSELDLIESGDKAKWDAAAESAHTHDNKSVLDGIDATDVANWDSAYDNMLSGITSGTCGDFVQVSIGAKSDKTQSVGVAVTTGATSAATDSQHDGLATAFETKQYIDSQVSGQVTTARTITAGDMLTGGGDLSQDRTIAHCGVTYNNPTTSATGTIGTDRKFTALTGLAEDGFGHVTSATQTEYTLPAETQLSLGTQVGNGNVVTDIAVNDHEITLTKGLTALTAVTATGDSYVDASVASNSAITVGLKSVADSKEDIASASTTGSVADAKAVKDYVEDKVTSAVHFKEGTSSLPASSETGDMWVATADIAIPTGSSSTGAAVTAETGDFIIAGEDGKWSVIEKNLTGAVTAGVDLTANALVAGNGNQTVKVAPAVGDATHPIYINASGVPVTANTIHDVSATGTTAAASALTWNTDTVLGNVNVDGTDYTIKVKLPENPNTDTATTENGHYAPSTSASTVGDANGFIRQINIDSKNHVISVVTGTPEAVEVVDCAATITTASTTLATVAGSAITANISVSDSAATIPMSASTATTLATVGGQDITAKVAMNSLTIAGANSKADGETFDGTTDIEILVLDCGEY